MHIKEARKRADEHIDFVIAAFAPDKRASAFATLLKYLEPNEKHRPTATAAHAAIVRFYTGGLRYG